MKILVVGSGPSGVHFAFTALEKGHEVMMVDVGWAATPSVMPDANYAELKSELADPVDYFVGSDYGAIRLPAASPVEEKEYYGFPPSKNYALEVPEEFSCVSNGIAPLVSFAAGGLAELWTAGAYPLNDHELATFPFDYTDIAPHYGEVARRIGIIGEADDLARFYPTHDQVSAPLTLDESNAALLSRYRRKRDLLTAKLKIFMGRSRQAVLARPQDGREACRYCGRCLWGCPNGAFYTPSLTLQQCRARANFTYISGAFASHFELNPDGPITALIGRDLNSGLEQRWSADAYVLAAGALGSSNIVLRSIYRARNEIIRLPGLMDNRQLLVPFVNGAMLGRNYDPNTFQYHQLSLGVESDTPETYVHGQITTLKTSTAHAIFQNLPLDVSTAIQVFRTLRSGLGMVNLSFCDRRRDDNYITLSDRVRDKDGWPALSISYNSANYELEDLAGVRKRIGRFFRALAAPVIPGMTYVRPMGSSVHYSGTLPMSASRLPWGVSPSCQSYDIENLYVVDGAVMPFLPAKNLTFTLMANAVRAAETAF